MEKWLVTGFVVLFPLLWCFVSFVLAHISGWSRLAGRFRTADAPKGEVFFMQPGRIGAVRYTSCLTICVTDGGMYLAVFPLWRIGHPPLFIPWAEFNNFRQTKAMFWSFVEASVGSPPIARVSLRPWTFPLNVLRCAGPTRLDNRSDGESDPEGDE